MCTEGEQVKVYWSEHGNTAGHNHIKHTFNVVNDDGLTRLGAENAGVLKGTFDLGKKGPWKVHFEYQTSELHFPSSHFDTLSMDINEGDFRVHHYNDMPSAAKQELYFYTNKNVLDYSFTWDSSTAVETAHMGVFDGIATCSHTAPPTPAPFSDTCSHVTCARVASNNLRKPENRKPHMIDGEVVNYDDHRFTVTHHKHELGGSVAQCGYLDTRKPDRCVCLCAHSITNFYVHKDPNSLKRPKHNTFNGPSATAISDEQLFQSEMTADESPSVDVPTMPEELEHADHGNDSALPPNMDHEEDNTEPSLELPPSVPSDSPHADGGEESPLPPPMAEDGL